MTTFVRPAPFPTSRLASTRAEFHAAPAPHPPAARPHPAQTCAAPTRNLRACRLHRRLRKLPNRTHSAAIHLSSP